MAHTPPIKLEADFTLNLSVRINGYGGESHKEQMASEVKRVLEVNFQREIEVYLMPEFSTEGAQTFHMPVKRLDRNAKQERGEA